MSRKARATAYEAIYHIMCRSISEFLLFRDCEDKDYYLSLLKRYIDEYKCSLYAYCLMDNHLHLQLDPKGFDVSKFMQSLNTAYARYYNKKYQRHGHVFQGRFESRILNTDQYNLAVSAYIHNNPHDIEGFSGREEKYKYSSYGIYLGQRPDTLELIDTSFIMGIFNISNKKAFSHKYFEFVKFQRDSGGFTGLKKYLSSAVEYEYVSGRKVVSRDLVPFEVVAFISEKLKLTGKIELSTKYSRMFLDFRAFCAYALRVLCGLSYKDICNIINNVTISGCSHLCNKGYTLLKSDNPFYLSLFNELASL